MQNRKVISKVVCLRITFSFLFAISLSTVFAQEKNELLETAKEYFTSGDYYNASVVFGELMSLGYNDVNIQWNYAESNRLFNNYTEAVSAYQKLIKEDGGIKYPLARFYLAEMLRCKGKYSDAKARFQEYLLQKLPDEFYVLKAKQSIVACEFALNNLKSDLLTEVLHLGKQVNTSYSEFGAWSSGDTVLYFSAMRKITEDNLTDLLPGTYLSNIYKSQIVTSGYKNTQILDKRVNDEEIHTANFTYDSKNNVAYFTRCEDIGGELVCQIYKSRFANGRWTKATRLNDKINVNGFTSTQPWIVNDSLYDLLFFVSNRPGGIGNLDIWYSVISDGEPQLPINLGFPINTPGNEITPFYHYSTKTLYFSSDWHIGYGGYDVFKSKGERNYWEKPVNAGLPINSSSNDLYYALNEDTTTAYVTSNRPGSYYIKGETCCNDIFEVRFKPTLMKQNSTAQIDDSIRNLLPLSLFFHNDEPDPGSKSPLTSKTYVETLTEYSKLQAIYGQNYSLGLKGKDSIEAINTIKSFFKDSVQNGFDKLNKIKDYLYSKLRKGESVALTLRGYASPLNSNEYNEILSKRRIQSFINYLRTIDSCKFIPYIKNQSTNGAQLSFNELPLGEGNSGQYVSDNPNDQRNSIYSISAAKERRIEILYFENAGETTNTTDTTSYPRLVYDPLALNLGEIKSGEQKAFIFRFRNGGDKDLKIEKVDGNGLLQIKILKDTYSVGESGYFQVFINAVNRKGDQVENVILKGNFKGGTQSLKFQFNVD